jgi:hypothetical protein
MAQGLDDLGGFHSTLFRSLAKFNLGVVEVQDTFTRFQGGFYTKHHLSHTADDGVLYSSRNNNTPPTLIRKRENE